MTTDPTPDDVTPDPCGPVRYWVSDDDDVISGPFHSFKRAALAAPDRRYVVGDNGPFAERAAILRYCQAQDDPGYAIRAALADYRARAARRAAGESGGPR